MVLAYDWISAHGHKHIMAAPEERTKPDNHLCPPR